MKKWWNGISRSWYYSLSLVWVFIIALQWINYADGVWYQETTPLVLATMAVVAIIDILIPLKIIYRLIIKLFAVLGTVYYVLDHYGFYSWQEGSLTDNVETFVDTISPYLWFVLSAWVLIEVSARIGSSRRAIIMFVGTNIAALSILDSFTTSMMWEEVAWVVFAGMGWLVSNHFRYFQQRFPKGWKHLRRYPLKIIFNIAVIFSIILLVGVNVPEVQPTLKDPYTAWKNWRGEAVITVNGSNPLNGQGASSGYSREDSNLGGGFNFDYTPVMTVSTTSRSYWRGETRTVYSGEGWIDRSSNGWSELQSVEAGSELPLDESSDVEKKTVKQQVKMLSEDNVTYPVLFGAYTIGRVTDVDGGSDTSQLDWRSNPGEIHWSPTRQNRKFPESYSLVSRVPIIPVKELEKKTFNQLYADKSLDQYLQVPSELPDRVRNLAKEVTASGDTPYEKVELLQQYLQNNFAYTNNPDLSKKKSRDFVDSFLFEVKEGYCDYYSTAMVMMARSLDIPARWVKGYAPGQASGYVTSDYFPDGATEYTVTNADAHSWAEIYFADYGWVPIEATPGFDMPMVTETVQTPSGDTPTPEPEEEEQTPEEEETATPVQDNEPAVPTSVIWIASSVILAWAAVMIIRYRRELSFMIMRMRQGEALTPQQKIMAESKRWLAWMKRHGMDRRSYETLRESVSRWEEVRPDLAAQLTPLLELFEKAKYSPDQITEEEWTSMQHHLQNLRKRWRKRATK